MDCHWHHRVDFPDYSEGKYGSCPAYATLVHSIQRCLEKLEQCILALEQEPHGHEEPTLSDSESEIDHLIIPCWPGTSVGTHRWHKTSNVWS